jgi:hypothetical protein
MMPLIHRYCFCGTYGKQNACPGFLTVNTGCRLLKTANSNTPVFRVLFDTCSVLVRKKDVFSEQVPKDYRRTPEEEAKGTCQNLPKPDNSRHSFPGYLKIKNAVLPSFR